MSNLISGNQKHLTLDNRVFIEKCLDQDMSMKDIAKPLLYVMDLWKSYIQRLSGISQNLSWCINCRNGYCTWQKPGVEKSHKYIRYILPKGSSFDKEQEISQHNSLFRRWNLVFQWNLLFHSSSIYSINSHLS